MKEQYDITLPLIRNPFFTGHEHLLSHLRIQLATGPQALIGLGGIGKTHIAVEYAYRYYQEYEVVLWTVASNQETLICSYDSLVSLLNLPLRVASEQELTIGAVKHWLETHQKWLLILDDVGDLDGLLDFLPSLPRGHILITTRAWDTQQLAQRVEVETLPDELGALFLLRRAGLLLSDAPFEQASLQDQTLALEITREFGGLPLALDQAGAYLEATGCRLPDYLQIYQCHRVDLLNERRGVERDHPEPVAATWLRSFQQVQARNATAVELLYLLAFLAPDAIGEELLLQGKDVLGPVLTPMVEDRSLLEQAFEVLRAYSLITRDPTQKTLSIHRLVQAVIRDSLSHSAQQDWKQRAVRLLNAASHLPYFNGKM